MEIAYRGVPDSWAGRRYTQMNSSAQGKLRSFCAASFALYPGVFISSLVGPRMVSLSLRKKASRDSFSPTTGDWATWYLFQLSRARLCGFVLAASAIIVLLAGNLSGREAQDAVPRSSKQEVTLPSSAASLAAAGSTGGSAFSELPLNSRWKYPIIWAAPFFSQSGQ
eukprot:1154190-Pelagomonas_calceolata.AAC.6